jgi:hypothetical protein
MLIYCSTFTISVIISIIIIILNFFKNLLISHLAENFHKPDFTTRNLGHFTFFSHFFNNNLKGELKTLYV